MYCKYTIHIAKPIFLAFRAKARLGDKDLISNLDDEHIEVIDILQVKPHPKNKNYTFFYDIAVFELDRLVHFSDFISPICLPNTPNENADFYKEKIAFFIGWGKKNSTAVVKRAAKLKILRLKINSQRYILHL